jgi:hypothetical protein
MELWQRKILFTAGGKEFDGEDFTINFKVPFSTSENPDVTDIEIYNITNESISAIENKAYAIINAGYNNNIGNIFTGKIEKVDPSWSGVNKSVKITASDGGFEWRKTRIQKAYTKGSKASYIMKDLAGLLGLEVVEVSPKKDITYQLGKTISGPVEVALKQLTKDTGSKMYINKGKLYIRDGDKGTSTGFLLNSETGLIGSPERVEEEDEKGNKIVKYNVKCLLNNKITTDSIIQIQSKTINGNYRVIEGSHVCSESEFVTEMIVK